MTKNINLADFSSSVEEYVKAPYYTAYELAKVVNEVLKTFELKTIPPQMVYNYKSKGLIKSVDRNGQSLVAGEVARAWIIKYVGKKLTK